MSYEDFATRNIDRRRERREELSPMMQRAHERALQLFADPDFSIQMSEFKEVYDEATRRTDANYVAQQERFHRERDNPQKANAAKISTVLEAIFIRESEMSHWLGNASTLKTSPYDDYRHKVDMLAEWPSQEGSRVLALAVDVTSGATQIEGKLEEIKREIEADKLGMIKYFKDMHGDFKGQRYNMPRTVVGVSPALVEELAQLWVNNDNKALAAHPVQKLMIDEIITQLAAMRSYADRCGSVKAVRAYDQALAAMRPVKNAKAGMDTFTVRNDPAAQAIFTKTRELFTKETTSTPSKA